jgi:hypothetical protein
MSDFVEAFVLATAVAMSLTVCLDWVHAWLVNREWKD